jgi:hypothetical protein
MIEERDFELDEFDQEDESWEELETDEKTAFIVAIVRQNEASADVEASLDELERLATPQGSWCWDATRKSATSQKGPLTLAGAG